MISNMRVPCFEHTRSYEKFARCIEKEELKLLRISLETISNHMKGDNFFHLTKHNLLIFLFIKKFKKFSFLA